MKRWLISVALLASSLNGANAASASDKKFVAMETEARHTLTAEPNNVEARFQLARLLAWQSRFVEARKHYELLIRIEPKNADYLLGLAQVHLWAKQPARALPAAIKARKIAPDYADVWHVHIQALLGMGDAKSTKEAKTLRAAAHKRFPQRDWSFAALDATIPATSPSPAVAQTSAPAVSPAKATQMEAVPHVVAPSASTATAATSPATPPTASSPNTRIEAELSTTQERLTKNLPSWVSNAIFLSWRDTERRSWYGGWRDVSRYQLNDTEAHIGTVQPLGDDFLLQGEAGGSGSHRFLARSYAQLILHKNFGTDWLASAGWKESHFDAGRSVLGTFALERTLQNYRVGYTLYEGRPDGAGFSPSHRIHVSHDYGDRNAITVAMIDGRETESSGNGRFISSPVNGMSVSGKHWFTPDWALSWEMFQQKQGDLYTRKGLTLGIRRAF